MKFVDLVRNWSTTVGTGDFTLGLAVDGFESIADSLAIGDQFYYSIVNIDLPAQTESGVGTLSAGGIVQRAPRGGVATDFGAGNKQISLVVGAAWFVETDDAVTAIAGITGSPVALLDTDPSLAANSDLRVSSQKAVKSFARQVAANLTVADRAGLAATDTINVHAVFLREANREGMFVWSGSNHSADVTADPRQGIYVAPSSDPTGASGAWVRKYDGNPSPSWWGADPTGAADASPAIVAMVAVLPISPLGTHLKVIDIDGVYSLQTECDLSGEKLRMVGAGGMLLFQRGNGDTDPAARLYGIRMRSGILEMDGVSMDGGPNQPTTGIAGGKNTYGIRVGPGENVAPEVADTDPSLWMERVSITNCRLTNFLSVGSIDVATNLKVFHAIYAWGVTSLIVDNNYFAGVSGAAIFTKQVAQISADNNTVLDTQWYGFNFSYQTSGHANENIFNCRLPTGIYKGGAINTVNDFGFTRNVNMIFDSNQFYGYYSYGAVLRCQSDFGVTISNNWFGLCQIGSLSAGSLMGIGVVTRGPIAPNNGSEPPRNIRIIGNKAMLGFGSGDGRALIYVHNDFADGSIRNPIYGLTIEGNRCSSPTATEYMTALALVSGSHGGIEDVRIFNNIGTVYLRSAAYIKGGIGVRGSTGFANDAVVNVKLGSNHVINNQPPVDETQSCLYIGAYTNEVEVVGRNKWEGGFAGVNVDNEGTVTGPTIEGVDNGIFASCTHNLLLDITLSRWASPLTWADGVKASHTGDLVKTVMKTITVPARSIGPSGSFEFEVLMTRTGSGGAVILFADFGALNVMTISVAVANICGNAYRKIQNRNNAAQQVTDPVNYTAYSISTGTLNTGTVDTTQDVTFTVSVQLSNIADSAAIEFLTARVNHGN